MRTTARTTAHWMMGLGLAVTPLTLGVLGCGAAPDAESAPSSPISTVRDLSLGAEGDDVRAVNEYLLQHGYFPNEKLADEFPNWRPIIEQGPPDPSVFDGSTEQAVRLFQRNMGVASTGVVDEATRKVLHTPRCGVPDGITVIDPSDKFALLGGNFYAPGSAVTYKVTNGLPGQFTPERTQEIAAAAFAVWNAELKPPNVSIPGIGMRFNPTAGSANITISFGTVPQEDVGLTRGTVPSTITLSNAITWAQSDSDIGHEHLPQVMVHEIGHALGLSHSSAVFPNRARMFPGGDLFDGSELQVDDMVAISSKYDQYTLMSGDIPNARDISVGPGGTIWIVGSEPVGEDFGVQRFDGQHWESVQAGATRIAVGPGDRPWITTKNGTIYVASSNDADTDWSMTVGNGADIAVGYNGDVWVIGGWCGGGDCPIFKWNPNMQNWDTDRSGGAAVRIAVGHSGVPWVINSAKNFFRYTSSDPATGHWVQMPGQSDDLAIGPGSTTQGNNSTLLDIDYVWSIGRLANGMVSLAVWDEQAPLNMGMPTPPNPFKWVGFVRPCRFDTTSAVAVGPRAQPYVVCNGGTVVTPIR